MTTSSVSLPAETIFILSDTSYFLWAQTNRLVTRGFLLETCALWVWYSIEINTVLAVCRLGYLDDVNYMCL
jgi:hypothetical protein